MKDIIKFFKSIKINYYTIKLKKINNGFFNLYIV